MTRTYMPTKKVDQVAFSANFVAVVGADLQAYGVSEFQMSQFSGINSALQSAWTISEEPSTRTRVVVEARNNKLNAMRSAAERLVEVIQASPNVTSEMLIAAGLTVRAKRPKPSPAPTTAPVFRNLSVDGHVVTFSLVDADRQTHRAKPFLVMGANVFSATGELPPTDLKAWTFEGGVSDSVNIKVRFDASLLPGTKVWMTAVWFNRRSVAGPVANAVSTQIQFGGLSMGDMTLGNTPGRQAA